MPPRFRSRFCSPPIPTTHSRCSLLIPWSNSISIANSNDLWHGVCSSRSFLAAGVATDLLLRLSTSCVMLAAWTITFLRPMQLASFVAAVLAFTVLFAEAICRLLLLPVGPLSADRTWNGLRVSPVHRVGARDNSLVVVSARFRVSFNSEKRGKFYLFAAHRLTIQSVKSFVFYS